MTWRASDGNGGPEPLPPDELLRTRRVLATEPRPDVRAHHIQSAAAEARRARAAVSAQAFARRSARVIAGVAATIVVTTSLAGASILADPARSILPGVAASFLFPAAPDLGDAVDVDDLVEPVVEDDGSVPDPAPATDREERRRRTTTTEPSALQVQEATTTASTEKSTTSSPTSESTTTTTEDPDSTTTTIEDAESTTTTTIEDAESTTTTTIEDAESTTTTTEKQAPPSHARGGGGGS